MHITSVDNIPDLLRKLVPFTASLKFGQENNMKPKSLPSRLFNRNAAAASGETSNSRGAKYHRHVDCVDQPDRLDQSSKDDGQQVADDGERNEKWHKEIHFALLQEKYEPLMDEEAKEEKKRRKKESYKKVKKNVGKALRSTWKCLMLGLYNFAVGYSTPMTVAAAFVPDFHPGRNRT